MAALSASRTGSAQGIFRVIVFAAVNDGDTFASTDAPVAYWAASAFNPSTQGGAGVNVAYGSGVYTFYPGENSNTTVFLFIVE